MKKQRMNNNKFNRYCLALDLKDDPSLIQEYERLHKNVSAEIKKSILNSGIVNMQIYRTGNRLFMIIETDKTFSFEKKAAMDAENLYVQNWEKLMWKFQQPLPWAKSGEKWVIMDKIFSLE
ncbi:MAG: L-rhamnose mutarotase [Chitinophagaceae bacterium]